ncbi:hypothetical protein ccbrp13_08160 [Ktedonobacteria bacterium brp13]|nr:hypothetical protein ccbrp13_08160 [Ktedonobacteria bacterium brp13]
MTQKRRPIFREHALRRYMEQQENDVLPQFVSPPVFRLCWLLFVLVIIAGVLAWMERIPVYVNGSGVVFTNDHRVDAKRNEFDTLVFVPANAMFSMRNGLHGTIQVGGSGQPIDTQVSGLDPQVYSPNAVQAQYDLSCNVAQGIGGPTVVVRTQSFIPANEHVQSGTSVQGHVQIGTQRILSLFPIFDKLMGDS